MYLTQQWKNICVSIKIINYAQPGMKLKLGLCLLCASAFVAALHQSKIIFYVIFSLFFEINAGN